MKTRLTFIVILLALCSCGKETPQIEYLEVNRNNISGSWKLDSWNSEPMLEGSYFYINLVRNDGTYTIRQNLDGFPESGRTITGSYDLRDEVGIGKGFIIQRVNDQSIKTIEDLQKVVKEASTSKEPVLYIQGIYPTDKKGYFAVPLNEE